MGCGTSSAAGLSSVEKHPADLFVPVLRLQRLKIAKFDDFFEKFEDPANKIVDINNSLAGLVLDVKTASCALLGGFSVKFSSGTDHDLVLLQLAKADGTPVVAEEVKALQAKADIKAADWKLAHALNKLLATAPTGLKESPDGSLEGQADFNEALKNFKAAIGAAYTTKVIIKSASAVGAPTVLASVKKPEFKAGVETPHHEVAASLLDIASSRAAKDIYAAQISVAEQVHALAAASKGEPVAFEVVKNRLQEPDAASLSAPEKADPINKVVATYNIQAFKLVYASFNANAEVSIGSAIIALVKSLKTLAEQEAKDIGKDVTAAIPRILPNLTIKDDLTFDFGLDVSFQDPDLSHLVFPDSLPAEAKFVWNTVQGLQAAVVDLIAQFGPLKESCQELIDGSKEVFADLGDTIQAADLPMSDAMKAPGIIQKNTAAMTGLAAIFTAILALVKVIGDDLQASLEAIKKLAS